MLTCFPILLKLMGQKFIAVISAVTGVSNFSKVILQAPSKSSHTLAWTIENFEAQYIRPEKGERKVFSPTFQVKHPDGTSTTSWQAEIRVVSDYKVRAYLNLNSCPAKYLQGNGLLTTVSIWFGTRLFPRSHGYTATYEFKTIGDVHGWPDFISEHKLRWDGLLSGGTLRVRVDVTTFSSPEPQLLATANQSPNDDCEPIGTDGPTSALDLKLDFEFLLGNESFSDMKIQCGSHSNFPAHKAILAARSEVFKVMLESNMEELSSGIINVTDMRGVVFGILMRYMYTGKVDAALDLDCLIEVLYGAEKYGLKELKDYCFSKLVKCICEENVGTLAVAAHLYRAEKKQVKDSIRKFMEPKFFELMKNKEFRKLVDKHGEAFF